MCLVGQPMLSVATTWACPPTRITDLISPALTARMWQGGGGQMTKERFVRVLVRLGGVMPLIAVDLIDVSN
jgi:hypothetical protein